MDPMPAETAFEVPKADSRPTQPLPPTSDVRGSGWGSREGSKVSDARATARLAAFLGGLFPLLWCADSSMTLTNVLGIPGMTGAHRGGLRPNPRLQTTGQVGAALRSATARS